MHFDWDEEKNEINKRKHGISSESYPQEKLPQTKKLVTKGV